MKKLYLIAIFFVAMFTVMSCSSDDDNNSDENTETGGNTGGSSKVTGTVKITSISARRSYGDYLIDVTVQTSGVQANQVKMLGAVGGATSDADGSLWASVGSGETSGSCTFYGLQSKKTYYIKAFLKTSSGTVYSTIRSVTTPK